jgi:hypothetical protein
LHIKRYGNIGGDANNNGLFVLRGSVADASDAAAVPLSGAVAEMQELAHLCPWQISLGMMGRV